MPGVTGVHVNSPSNKVSIMTKQSGPPKIAKATGTKKRVMKTKGGTIESRRTAYDSGVTVQSTQKFKAKGGYFKGSSREVARKTSINGQMVERKGQGANKKKAFLRSKK